MHTVCDSELIKATFHITVLDIMSEFGLLIWMGLKSVMKSQKEVMSSCKYRFLILLLKDGYKKRIMSKLCQLFILVIVSYSLIFSQGTFKSKISKTFCLLTESIKMSSPAEWRSKDLVKHL